MGAVIVEDNSLVREDARKSVENTVKSRRYPLSRLRRINSHDSFHEFFLVDALERYRELVSPGGLGRVLGICDKPWEAEIFVKYPFSQIVLSGVTDQSGEVMRRAAGDPRVSYEIQNAEGVRHESGSFDLVYCKEGLHHLARPVQGLYEMLRICRRGVILIEPNETIAGMLLDIFKLASSYETNQKGNIYLRDNYVFRFSPGLLTSVLNSYYLRSGYHLEMRFGWISSRYHLHVNRFARQALCIAGWLSGCMPGSRGNYMTAIILPGKNLPPDPGANPAPGSEPKSAKQLPLSL